MPQQIVTIGLLWHSMNSDNLGVGALTIGNMAIVEDAARNVGLKPKFKVIGWDDPKPPYFRRDDIEVVGLRARDLNPLSGGLAQIVKDCDLVLDIGGGDSFTDIYGPGRISKMLMASNIILQGGVPLVMSPQTIGPFSNPVIKRAGLNILRRAAAVSSRDHLSTAFARDMGFDGALIEASDVALRLPYKKPAKRANGQTRVGLNVSGLLMNGGFSGDNMFGLKSDYGETVRKILHFFTRQTNCDIHLIGHVLSTKQPVEDDHRACAGLASEFPGVTVAPVFRDPSQAKSYIAGMDFFMGARMHACIAAFSTGVPVLPMAYSRKFEGFFGALNYPALADCKTDDTDTILAKAMDAYDNRDALKEAAASGLAAGYDRLKPYEASVQHALVQAVKAAA
ncbi:MAG: polysaccharide pyruvyl transferase family protein [Pseudomonadota bacterium]